MRDIAQQKSLRSDERFEPLGHVIEVVNQSLKLIRVRSQIL